MPPKKTKGKKKLTGTPDVQKFKVLPEFSVLEEILKLKNENNLVFPEAVVFDPQSEISLARLLNLFSQLSSYFGTFRYEPVVCKKDYRFHNTHNLSAPEPQYFPSGYNLETIILAKKAQSSLPPALAYNGIQYPFGAIPSKKDLSSISDGDDSPSSIAIDALSAGFLSEISKLMQDLIDMIERDVTSDFANSLTKFKEDMTLQMQKFDARWVEFEKLITSLATDVHARVLLPLVNLIQTEFQLTLIEENGDRNWEKKQELERKLIQQLCDFSHFLFEDTRDIRFPIDAVELAEAGLFYSTRLEAREVNLCRHVVKDFIQVRLELERVNLERCPLEFKEDKKLCRALVNLANSIRNASVSANKDGRVRKNNPVGSIVNSFNIDGETNNLQPQIVNYPSDGNQNITSNPGIVDTIMITDNNNNQPSNNFSSIMKSSEKAVPSNNPTSSVYIPSGTHASLRMKVPQTSGVFGVIRSLPRIISVKSNEDKSWATKRLLRDEVYELTNQLRNITRIDEDASMDPYLAAEIENKKLINAGKLHVDPRCIPLSRLAKLGITNPNISFGLDEVNSHTFSSTNAVRSDLDGSVTDLVQAVLAGNTLAETSKAKNLTHAALNRTLGPIGRPASSVRVASFNLAPSPLGNGSQLASAGMAILK